MLFVQARIGTLLQPKLQPQTPDVDPPCVAKWLEVSVILREGSTRGLTVKHRDSKQLCRVGPQL